jgi:hypothetical protein
MLWKSLEEQLGKYSQYNLAKYKIRVGHESGLPEVYMRMLPEAFLRRSGHARTHLRRKL